MAARSRALIAPLALGLVVGCTERIYLPAAEPAPSVDAEASVDIDASIRPARDAPVDAGPTLSMDASAGAGADTAIRVPEECERRSHSQENPHILIALDRSASMHTEKLGSSVTRVQAVDQVLLPLVRTHEHAIHFGYQDFPSRCLGPGGCCASSILEPSDGAFMRIKRSVECDPQFEECPTKDPDSPSFEALRRSANYFVHRWNDGQYSPRKRIVLLLTDGEPSCSSDRFGDPCDRAVQQIERLRDPDLDVKVVVVGLSGDLGTNACLGRMATAGGMAAPGGPGHRVVVDEGQLQRALDELLAPLAFDACHFRIKFAAGAPDQLLLHFDRTPVRWDPQHKDGWDFDGTSHSRFVVHGPLCERLRTAPVNVDVYSCPEKVTKTFF